MNKEEKIEYIIYDSMKQRNLGTLDLHRVLSMIGIYVSKKTLHTYLKTDFKNSKNPNLKAVALELIKNYDELIINLKENKLV